MANYADDCSPYEFSGSIEDVIQKLQHDSQCLIEWYDSNYLKPNSDKWHLLFSEKGEGYFTKIGNEYIYNSSDEKILGVYFDNKLNFNTHLKKIRKKASQKLHALARVSTFMSCKQRKLIMAAFIQSQFSYCPLLWMCHDRLIHSTINKIHERSLRIVYRDNISSFDLLVEKSGSVRIHHSNLQYSAIEIFKALKHLSSPLISELLKIKETKYCLRKVIALVSFNPKTTNYGINSISYLAPKVWDQIPDDIKKCESLSIFKKKVTKRIPKKCPCTLCKLYVPNLGYV